MCCLFDENHIYKSSTLDANVKVQKDCESSNLGANRNEQIKKILKKKKKEEDINHSSCIRALCEPSRVNSHASSCKTD